MTLSFDGFDTRTEIDYHFVNTAIAHMSNHSSKMVNKLLKDMGWSTEGRIAPCLAVEQVYDYKLFSKTPEHKSVTEELVEDLDYVLTELGYTIEWLDNGYNFATPAPTI